MTDTVVIQSHRNPLPYAWINECLRTVQDWCGLNGYEYRFIGDELFDYLPEKIHSKLNQQKVIASDLARLYILRQVLAQGAQRVFWFDSDVLIFNPGKLVLNDQAYAVGREVWVQHDKHDRLKVYKKVHNAVLMFIAGNSFLDFYLETAGRLLLQNKGKVPVQFIGPKLLTALHNVVQLPVIETVGMLSPLVIKDVLADGGDAVELFRQHSIADIAAANLCISSCERRQVSEEQMQQLIKILLRRQSV